MTRRQAIRKYYLWLHCGNRASVRDCTMYGHPLWPYRMGRVSKPLEDGQREPDIRTGADYRYDKPMQAAKAIRQTCIGCVETLSDVRNCPCRECPLWQYRMGRAVFASAGAVSDTDGGRVDINHHEQNDSSKQGVFNYDKEPHHEPARTVSDAIEKRG